HRQRAFARRRPPASAIAFITEAGAPVPQPWLDYPAPRPPPSIVTPEGDPLELTRVMFDVRDGAAVARVLASHPDLEAQAVGRYVWTEPVEPGADRAPTGGIVLEARPWHPDELPRRSLGTITIQGESILVQATSRLRAAPGR